MTNKHEKLPNYISNQGHAKWNHEILLHRQHNGYNYKNWQDQVLVKVWNWELSNSANGTENN